MDMPVQDRESTIGIFGSGTVSGTLNEQLLADQATGDVRFVIGYAPTPAIQVAIDFVREERIPYEFVAEPGTDVPKGAVRVTEAANVPAKVVQILERARHPKLLVYWSEQDSTAIAAIRRAIEAEIEVRDICDALTRLGKLIEPEEKRVAKTYTKDQLEAMEEDEIRPLAESMDISPDDYDSWEAVIDAMMEAQSGESAGDGDSEESEEDEEEGGFYTEEELDEFDLDDLKELCSLNKIDVKTGSRKPTYVKAILEFQKAVAAAESTEKPAKAATAPSVGLDLAGVVAGLAADIDKRLTKLVAEIDQALAQAVDKISETVVEALKEEIAKLVPKAASNGAAPAAEKAAPAKPKLRSLKK